MADIPPRRSGLSRLNTLMRLLAVLAALALLGYSQEKLAPPGEGEKGEEIEFLCPMDKDIRTKGPGKCPRCGMKLVAGIPDMVEYPVELRVKPASARAGQ